MAAGELSHWPGSPVLHVGVPGRVLQGGKVGVTHLTRALNHGEPVHNKCMLRLILGTGDVQIQFMN